VVEILKQAWTQDLISYQGEWYQLDVPTYPLKPYQQNGGPLLYFGGYSPDAVELIMCPALRCLSDVVGNRRAFVRIDEHHEPARGALQSSGRFRFPTT
jgi:hypothetical protein